MNNTKAFSLAEVLIVVTLLAILTSIGSVYLFQNFEVSRDTARKTNLINITQALDIYQTDIWKYLAPNSSVEVTYSGSTVWSQWVFGEENMRSLKVFWSDILKDPKYDVFFSYSTTNNNTEYQIAGIYEELDDSLGLSTYIKIVPEAHAAVNTAQVHGDFNGFMVRTKIWDSYSYIATPSIIASDLTSTDVVDIISGEKLVYNEFFNIPASYWEFIPTDGGFAFNVSDPLLFSGTNSELKTQTWLETLVEKLQYVYSRTPTESFDRYASFLGDSGYTQMKNFLEKNYKIRFQEAFSCQDLLEQWEAFTDGFYDIDVDGWWPLPVSTEFCTILDDNSAWMRIEENNIWVNGGDFDEGNHISTNYYSLYESSTENTIISLSNPGESWYVLHQTGDEESNYEIHFNDFSEVWLGNMIRMSLWVADNEGTWSNELWLNPEAWYMFHNRLFYTDGTFSSNGEVNVIETQNIWGKIWTRMYVDHIVQKTPQDFSWYIGLDAEDTKDLYFTWVKLELFRR